MCSSCASVSRVELWVCSSVNLCQRSHRSADSCQQIADGLLDVEDIPTAGSMASAKPFPWGALKGAVLEHKTANEMFK